MNNMTVNPAPEYPASRNADGTFTVEGYKKPFPYDSCYETYREMDAFYEDTIKEYPDGYVCRVEHNKANEFVLMLPNCESKYIIVI